MTGCYWKIGSECSGNHQQSFLSVSFVGVVAMKKSRPMRLMVAQMHLLRKQTTEVRLNTLQNKELKPFCTLIKSSMVYINYLPLKM
mmetsp:Transcript_22252/g.29089  ORF Transcript_22252/g.29089 Transcript_22252/m.29089 type:complete len:86 (-) Transcript_22252:29-286(-)